jgi:hypothetical protein
MDVKRWGKKMERIGDAGRFAGHSLVCRVLRTALTAPHQLNIDPPRPRVKDKIKACLLRPPREEPFHVP